MITMELLRCMTVGRVDVYVDGAVAVGAPASLTALADDFGHGPRAQDGVCNQMVDLFTSDVFDAQVVVDELNEIPAKVGSG
jgi:hypothetical protein